MLLTIKDLIFLQDLFHKKTYYMSRDQKLSLLQQLYNYEMYNKWLEFCKLLDPVTCNKLTEKYPEASVQKKVIKLATYALQQEML